MNVEPVRNRVPLDDACVGDVVERTDDDGATWTRVFVLDGAPAEVIDYEAPLNVDVQYRIVRYLSHQALTA